MPDVNIILATYNGEKYLREQLDSIMALDYEDYVLNVFDDCSTDSTVDIIKEYIERFGNKITLTVNEHNLGSTLSFLNNLIRVNKTSPSQYYMFCDQDDVWLSDKISISKHVMSRIENRRSKARPILIFNDALVVDEELNYLDRSFYRSNRLKVHKTGFNRMLMENKCIGCTMFMNKALVDLLGETGPQIRYHDWWMALIASAFGTVRFVKAPTIMYRQHSANQIGQTNMGEYIKKRSADKDDVRDRLLSTYQQAAFFKQIYLDRLSGIKRRRINAFTSLEKAGFFKKRFIVLKNRFFKSGFFRNVGLLFYI